MDKLINHRLVFPLSSKAEGNPSVAAARRVSAVRIHFEALLLYSFNSDSLRSLLKFIPRHESRLAGVGDSVRQFSVRNLNLFNAFHRSARSALQRTSIPPRRAIRLN